MLYRWCTNAPYPPNCRTDASKEGGVYPRVGLSMLSRTWDPVMENRGPDLGNVCRVPAGILGSKELVANAPRTTSRSRASPNPSSLLRRPLQDDLTVGGPFSR